MLLAVFGLYLSFYQEGHHHGSHTAGHHHPEEVAIADGFLDVAGNEADGDDIDQPAAGAGASAVAGC